MRDTFTWQLPRAALELGPRTLIMGILNLTPDSFSDRGAYGDPEQALDRAFEIEAEGADILDIGGESTRPGSRAVPEAEERARVVPVLERLASKIRIPISIDTWRSGVAGPAMASGAQIINDISGFRFDPGLAALARKEAAGVVLTHSRGTRETLHEAPGSDGPERVRGELGEMASRALEAGIARAALVLDPGIGFSKSPATSLNVLKRLHLFSKLSYPLLVGVSRKSFIRLSIPVPDAALWTTAAAVALAVDRGAHIVRVHDVATMRAVVEMADRIASDGESHKS